MNIKHQILIILAALAAGGLASAADSDTNAPATNAIATNAPPSTNATPTVTPAPPATNAADIAESTDAAELTPTNSLRMNFHDVPLQTILNYLSARMGFVVVSESEVRGSATIVSEQPVGTNEVLGLLSSALSKNNYNVTRDGRVLTIAPASDAITGPNTPVKHPQSPADIPINDEMATDILPVHILNPTQLIKDLDQLIPQGAKVSANEAGNALIMTARQKDIHRFAEIIAALDSSSVSEVEVFVLKYADAKSVADELKEVFQSPDSSVSRADARTRFQGGRGGGFPGFGGFGGGGGGGGGGNDNADSKNASNKAVFVSDDQMNAVVASAPPDYFPMITNVVDRLDQPTTDITMIKVFHLRYADPQEMADELANLFPDPTSSSTQNSRSMGMQFLPPFMRQQQAPASNKSERMTRQALVRAVPDPRTGSLIVTTSRDQMDQIAKMIDGLDNNPAQVKHVYAFQLTNADPSTAQAALAAIFTGPNSTASPQSSQNTSALAQRQTTAAQQQTTTSSASAFGSGSGSGSSALH